MMSFRHAAWLLVVAFGLFSVPARAALICPTTTPSASSISGVVNDYWAGSGSPSAGSTSITLGSRRTGGAGNSIAAGDVVMIMQMQDANINITNSNAYGSGGTSGAGSTSANSSGLYEYVIATNSVGSGGGTLTFSSALANSYRTRAYTAGSNGQSSWQAIRIPRYLSATASNVSTPAWNGATGGVVALDVVNTLTLSSGTSINVAGLGFRGGAGRQHQGANPTTGLANTDYATTAGLVATGTSLNGVNASKGEGIAGTPRFVNSANGTYNGAPAQVDTGAEGYPNGSYARGAPGNAGGGGTDGNVGDNGSNTGGGGGSNYGAGGQGGNAWSFTPPAGNFGGKGGATYNGTLDFNRVFMGGGGGAGTTNNASSDTASYTNPAGLACGSGGEGGTNALCSSGAAGGGIVIVRAGSVTGTGLIDARGADAYNVGRDGAGGGGAGGSVVLQTYGSGNATVNASGGNGGNAWRNTPGSANRHGPGGGGGGGFIAYSPSSGLTLTASYSGGLNGLTSDDDVFGSTSSGGGISAFDTPTVPGATLVCDIAGVVFEDINYGGGAGRSQSVSSGAPVPGTRVELYTSTGSFDSFVTTDASGNYGFGGLMSGSYTVRVVNSSVRSTRTGGSACTTCLPVQTWRTTATAGTATAVTDRVGGENPALADAGNGSTSTTLAVLTTTSTTPQSISSVTYGSTPITGVDFGYNFDTIVNVNNTGQGSLSQFITNANALGGEGTLAQSGFRTDLVTGSAVALASGVEQSIFMIPSGSAVPGIRAAVANQLTSGRALIPVTTALPALNATARIEGGTQTYNVGNTNNVTLGAGGTVGVGAIALPQLNGPEVELRDGPTGAGGLAIGIDVQAVDSVIRGLSVVGFGGTAASDTNGNIRIGNVTGVTIAQNVLGVTALSFTDPGATLRGTGDSLRISQGDSGTVSQNLIGFSNGNGIGLGASDTNGWIIEYNEIRSNAIASSSRNGIELTQNTAASPNSIRYNLIAANGGAGIHLVADGADSNTITQNTLTGNGGTNEPGGIRDSSGDNNIISLNIIHTNTGPGVEFLTGSSDNTVSQNQIYSNSQSGIEVDNGAATNTLTQNSTYNNTRIGIDLLSGAAPTSPYYTQNDNGDGDAGGNNLLNFPQITSASISGGSMTVTGIAPAGALVEIFVSDSDPTGFGEGKTYLISRTEGLAGDDAATGTSANTVSCGTGAVSVTMNNFSFTFPKPGAVTGGTVITTTATLRANTSEFSCNATVVNNSPNFTFLKTVATISDPVNGTSNPKNIPGAIVEYSLIVTNSGGAADSNTIFIRDAIPANTAMYVNSLGTPDGPIAFSQGTTSSGLTYTFGPGGSYAAKLASTTDDVDFSDVLVGEASTDWDYVPTPGTDGCDPLVKRVRINPKGVFVADTATPDPSFTAKFRVCVR